MNNVIKGAMQNYRICKRWMDAFEEKEKEFYYRMQGKTSSSAIAMPSGQPNPNAVSNRITSIDVELKEYQKENQEMHNHCMNTIVLCNLKLNEVTDPSIKKILFSYYFDLSFEKPKDAMNRICKDAGYSLRRIYQVIDEETTRLSK